jgi:hypothetical protein
MKKTALLMIFLSVLITWNVSGQTTPVTISISPLADAGVCKRNIQSGININNLPSTTFNLGILLEIVDANGALLTSPSVQCSTSGGGGTSH